MFHLQVSKPANVSFQDAASVPLAGMTAYTSLIKSGGAKAGSRVLINGGTGGVGAWAVQIAKAQGCHVVATCSDKSFDLAKSLGADELVDYKAGDLNENLKLRYGEHNKRFDVVFDVSLTRSQFACESGLTAFFYRPSAYLRVSTTYAMTTSAAS